MISLATLRYQQPKTSPIMQRIAGMDITAVKTCIDVYGDFVWALARKLTASRKEAEVATEEIFIDIWRYCEHPGGTQSVEKKLIAMIALRRLIKSLSVTKKNLSDA